MGGNSVGMPSAAVSATGTIPGSGGDIPGMPDAWCSLYRVHQYRERQAAVTPAEVRQDLFGEQQERCESREATELGADVPVAAVGDEPRVRDSSPEVDDIYLTQQLARANDPQQVDPAVSDAAGDDDSMAQCLAKNKDTDTLAALNSHPLQQDMGSDEDQLEEDMPNHPLEVDDDDSEDEGKENLEADVGRCKRILCGGGVLWTANLAAAHDEDHGALLLVFYAYLRGKRVKTRWHMDLVEVGVPRMEYVKGALLLEHLGADFLTELTADASGTQDQHHHHRPGGNGVCESGNAAAATNLEDGQAPGGQSRPAA
ncbi:hypothetical protein CYMTET_6644 [Cymbomonas tetramitiformis]|uniref:Uncharacterized protein n=1 Tax=Cymbomonas tetramitiformis TaxID=36881 RepID=A0AAE0GWT2_9CHLO|nr:hypothetical protein CYMTET_6644 [Cymbomonas tetramitiformis]